MKNFIYTNQDLMAMLKNLLELLCKLLREIKTEGEGVRANEFLHTHTLTHPHCDAACNWVDVGSWRTTTSAD